MKKLLMFVFVCSLLVACNNTPQEQIEINDKTPNKQVTDMEREETNIVDSKNKTYELMNAVKMGNVQQVRKLIAAGVDVNFMDLCEYKVSENGNTTILHEPCYKGGNTALIYAARKGYIEIVKLLLEAGADVNAYVVWMNPYAGFQETDPTPSSGHLSEKDGNAMMQAAEEGHTEIVKILLDKGADINIKDIVPENNALTRALYRGYAEIVKILLAKGADTKVSLRRGDLLKKAASSGLTEIVELLLNEKYGPNTIINNQDINEALFSAVGNPQVVKILLNHGADVNIKKILPGPEDFFEYTPLMFAAKFGHIETVKLLLDKGADVNAIDMIHGTTALMYAQEKGYTEIVELLKSAGAKE